MVKHLAHTMKTTIDIPEDLVRTMKMRAVQERRKFKDVATEIFRRGLSVPDEAAVRSVRRRVKLPLIIAPHGAAKFALSADDIDKLLMDDEVKSIL